MLQVRVMDVDTGRNLMVPLSDVRHLPPPHSLSVVPPLAIPCSLYGVCSSHLQGWWPLDCQLLWKLTNSREVSALWHHCTLTLQGNAHSNAHSNLPTTIYPHILHGDPSDCLCCPRLGSKVTFYGYKDNWRTCTFEGSFMLTSWDGCATAWRRERKGSIYLSMKIWRNVAILFYCNFYWGNYWNINNMMNIMKNWKFVKNYHRFGLFLLGAIFLDWISFACLGQCNFPLL